LRPLIERTKMILWGSNPKTYTEKNGNFYCPECSDYKNYELKKVKKYFTLFFILQFEKEDLGKYIECGQCKSTFKEGVLKHDPKASDLEIRGLYFSAARDIMISIAMADGKIGNDEFEKIVNSFREITQIKLEKAELLEAIRNIKVREHSISEISKEISPYLNNQGKETVLRAAITISKADGVIQDEEINLLHSLSEDLLLPKAYANGIFIEEKITPK
jgi:tellurite resistance protein